MQQPKQSAAPASPSPGINLGDIYHVLFRHKWKILAVWIVGLTATAVLWMRWPTRYQSISELYVRYVMESRAFRAVTGETEIQPLDRDGQGIMNTEVQILESFDLALEVADQIGPANVLAKIGGGSDRHVAASVIQSGLKIDLANRSAVIQISFKHADRELVQPVLRQYIASYLKKHSDIHQASGAQFEFLAQQTDLLKPQLAQTDQELRKAEEAAGVTSMEDDRRSCTERLTRIQNDFANTEAELAEQKAALNEPIRQIQSNEDTNTPTQTAVPNEKRAEYRRVRGLLDDLEQHERELLVTYTPENGLVKEVRQQISECQSKLSTLLDQYPQLAGTRVTEGTGDGRPMLSRFELASQRIRELEARMEILKQQRQEVKTELSAINNLEGTINELQRKKELQEQNYRLFSASLEKARIDESFGSGHVSNITVIQQPCPPFQDRAKLVKLLQTLLMATFAGGLALAFGVELFLDRSFKRPSEVESKLGLPLFISIPERALNGKAHSLASKSRLIQWNSNNGHESDPEPAEEMALPEDITSVKPVEKLHEFFESLRDRLIMFFELKNMTHNPKLVAVTSCGEGAGVTTVASGLAASLSETGEGNVLLVDMNVQGGTAHYFHKGKLACGLDEALEAQKRSEAQVGKNLYVVSETTADDKLPRILHKRFTHLLPRLKASDYDYIIFDMPPVNQLSPTSKVARFMDIVLMVVEAEKTDRDVAKHATKILAESKSNVGIVLNKTHSYVPRMLHQQL